MAEKDLARFYENNLMWDEAIEHYEAALAFANTHLQLEQTQLMLDRVTSIRQSSSDQSQLVHLLPLTLCRATVSFPRPLST